MKNTYRVSPKSVYYYQTIKQCAQKILMSNY